MLSRLLGWLRGRSREAAEPVCFFATGTGRCGSMLLSQVLSIGTNVNCHHERSITTTVMKDAYHRADLSLLRPELENNLFPAVEASRQEGKIYGECSAHLFLLLRDIYERYGERTRFIHLIRRPDTFAQSALARGFFNPAHPHALEHIRPPVASDMGQRWEHLQPLEKCLWYWNEVNSRIADSLQPLPAGFWRVQRIEDFGLDAAQALFAFLGINRGEGASAKLEELIGLRVNASPGLGDERHVNPWSKAWSLPDYPQWSEAQRGALLEFAAPLARSFYPEIRW
jgi:hypothetical protein